LLVQKLVHAPVVEDMLCSSTADVHLILAEAGRTLMEKRVGERRTRYNWVPGRLEMSIPDQTDTRSYRAAGPLRSAQVHIPRGTVERLADELGGRAVDYERMAASVEAGDPLLEQAIRTLAVADEKDDLYAESAATFMAAHLLTHHSGRPGRPIPVREDARIRKAIAVMRGRLAEPLTLAGIADEVYLSVYHFVRVFKEATGETPHRFLTRLRVEEAQRLLRGSDLSIAKIASRCGFASPGALSTAFLRHTGMRPSAYRNL
jgi:AraC family transcriptional regulator